MPRRPAVPLDPDELERLAAIGATVKEVGALFGIAQSTLSERLAREPLKTSWQRGSARAALSVRRKLFQMMEEESSLGAAVWISKNLPMLGFREPPRESHVEADVRSNTTIRWVAEWGRPEGEYLPPADGIELIEGEADEE